MRNLVYFFILFIFCAIVSCKYPTEFQQVKSGHIELLVPPYVKKVDNLRDKTPVQYSSKYRNVYIVCWSEPKGTKTYETYYAEATGVILKALEHGAISDSATTNLNGLKQTESELFGNMKDGPDVSTIYYRHVLKETADSYYQLCVWTRGQDRYARYKDDINKVLKSFKVNE